MDFVLLGALVIAVSDSVWNGLVVDSSSLAFLLLRTFYMLPVILNKAISEVQLSHGLDLFVSLWLL